MIKDIEKKNPDDKTEVELEMTMYYPKFPNTLFHVTAVKDTPKVAITKLIDVCVEKKYFSGKYIVAWVVRHGIEKRKWLQWGDLDVVFIKGLIENAKRLF